MDGPFARFALAVVVALVAVGGAAASTASAAPVELIGTFRVDGGSCGGGAVTGTYLRMVLPTGTREGPFLANGDSGCADQTFTPLGPGRDGGLVTGGYQPEPSPGFDAAGNSRAAAITAPTGFFGVAFSTSTNPVDPQTGAATAAPRITADGTSLTGDLSAFAASWNDQEFNQGGPKPGGALPGNTAAPTGTYDPATGAFTLEWTSQIQGGPFDRFTGLWHLEGTFVPATGPSSDGPTGPSSDGPSTGGAGDPGAARAGGGDDAGAGTGASVAGPAATSGTPGAGGVASATGSAGSSGSGAAAASGTAGGGSSGSGDGSGGAADDEQALVDSARAGAGTDDGWEPPPWLVLLLAAIGVAGFAAYVRLDRAVRRLEPAAEASP